MDDLASLALIAAVVSFGHMHELALRHGETSLNATLIPLSVDGMVVASSMSVLLAGRIGVSVPWLPWTLLIVGSLASLAANVEVRAHGGRPCDCRLALVRLCRGLSPPAGPAPGTSV